VLGIPENYKVLFLQGGATLQFGMVPLNILKKKADYAVTGSFSGKAYKEACNIAAAHGMTINLAGTTKDIKFAHVPTQAELKLDPEADYFHICFNNTIYGSKWHYIPETGKVPLVADLSSCICSEPVDVKKFGIIYAGAQKNIAPAGVTIVIIREDFLGEPMPGTPVMLNYKTQSEGGSMYNTPPCWSIYIAKLVMEWIDGKMGGLAGMQKHNQAKAKLLYDYLDSQSFYKASIDKIDRSMMNVTFRTGNDETDAKFVKESVADGMTNLKGHKETGGMRASIYNAMPIEGVKHLVEFMDKFAKANK
jgi:phosphoserine aminotransferase